MKTENRGGPRPGAGRPRIRGNYKTAWLRLALADWAWLDRQPGGRSAAARAVLAHARGCGGNNSAGPE